METGGDQFVLDFFDREKDYEMYTKWCGENPVPKSSLPPLGVKVGDKAIGFVALTDCDFGVFCWYQANPENKPRETYQAFKIMFLALCQMTKDAGRDFVFCYTAKTGIVKLLESLNFIKIGDGHMAIKVS